MAHTDKDRPFWVQNAEHGHIQHDHRNGKCIISDDQRDRWNAWAHHRSKCKKHVRVDFACQPKKVNGKREIVFERDDIPWRKDCSRKSCWTWTCDCPYTEGRYGYTRVYDDGSWRHGISCEDRYFNECLGHYGYIRDDSIPCSCDDTKVATCFPAWGVGRYYAWGGVPSWYIRNVYHSPERRREREDLRSMAREYNAYGDLEDGDFVNRQGRNSARWTWW